MVHLGDLLYATKTSRYEFPWQLFHGSYSPTRILGVQDLGV